MNAALSELRRTYAEDDRAARAWKAAGGKVVGYLGRAPEALIAAAGFLPYRLRGRPDAGDAALRRYLYPLFNKAQAVRGLIDREQPNAILERLFGGAFNFADHLLIVADRKDISQMLTHLRAAAGSDPGLRLPEVHFVDRAPAGGFAASEYNRQSLLRLKGPLEAWAGQVVREDALAAAIAEWNRDRTALGKLETARAQGRLSGPDALAALGAGWLMPKRDHADLLEAALDGPLAEPPAGVRLAVVGSPLDHDRVHAALQEQGATVVFDGHDWGESALAPPHTGDLPPFEAVVEQFNAAGPSMMFPLASGAARLAERAKAAGAQGALVLAHRGDSLAVFDAPDLMHAFEAVGLPTLFLAEQPYVPDVSSLGEAVRPLLARLAAARA